MMQWRKSWISVLAMALSLCAGVMVITSRVHAQTAGQSLDWLTVEMLKDSGVHLPSYLDSVSAQMAYQIKVPLHQEITVKWSTDAGGQQSSDGGLVLTKRWQHMQNSATMGTLKPIDQPILVIATTLDGEVRALILCADTRAATSQLAIQLPQDGQISRLIFFNIAAGSSLERIGQVELGQPDGVLHSASKSNTSSVAH